MTETVTCRLADVFDRDKKGVNLALVFSWSEEEWDRRRDSAITVRGAIVSRLLVGLPAPTIPTAPSGAALPVTGTSDPRIPPAALPQLQAYSFKEVSGSLTNGGRTPTFQDQGQLEILLPKGIRFVNAVTLKAMLGQAKTAVVLKRVGAAWKFLADTEIIDLTDDSQEYRVGEVQIYS